MERSCLNGSPRYLIIMRKCPAILPDASASDTYRATLPHVLTLVNGLIDRLIDWLIDWLTERITRIVSLYGAIRSGEGLTLE